MNLRVKEALKELNKLSGTMRKRFIVYLLCLFGALVILLLGLLNLLGIGFGDSDKISVALDRDVEKLALDYDRNVRAKAAYLLKLSNELSGIVNNELERQNIQFEDLNNNYLALFNVQQAAFVPLQQSMQAVHCSGVLFALNVSINTNLKEKYVSNLYLKYTNYSSENTLNDPVVLFRGDSEVASVNDIGLAGAWEIETQLKDQWRYAYAQLSRAAKDNQDAYIVTELMDLTNTWESVRYVLVPIRAKNSEVIGVCGFEINDLLCNFVYENQTEPHVINALLEQRIDGSYVGNFAGSHAVHRANLKNPLTVINEGTLVRLSSDSYEYVGKTKEVTLGGKKFLVMSGVTDRFYQQLKQTERLRYLGVLAVLFVLTLGISWWLSHYYITPFMNQLEQARIEKELADEQAKKLQMDKAVTEEVLAKVQVEKAYTEQALEKTRREQQSTQQYLERMRLEKLEAEQKLQQLEDQHRDLDEQLRLFTAKVQELSQQKSRMELEYKRISEEFETAQNQLSKLIERKQHEINEEKFEYFVEHLSELTSKEREIFDMYIRGIGTKDIIEKIGITDNTLKYHNRNIYGKLGVSNRKEMLLYAMKLQNK